MPAPTDELLWDDWNAEHLARHHVSPTEVNEVCFGEPWILRWREGRSWSLARHVPGATSWWSWESAALACSIRSRHEI